MGMESGLVPFSLCVEWVVSFWENTTKYKYHKKSQMWPLVGEKIPVGH
jgi:hypothetical protein